MCAFLLKSISVIAPITSNNRTRRVSSKDSVLNLLQSEVSTLDNIQGQKNRIWLSRSICQSEALKSGQNQISRSRSARIMVVVICILSVSLG